MKVRLNHNIIKRQIMIKDIIRYIRLSEQYKDKANKLIKQYKEIYLTKGEQAALASLGCMGM